MALQEYDPSLSPSEYNVGESYVFIRNAFEEYDQEMSKGEDKTISKKKSGVREVTASGVRVVEEKENIKKNGVREVKSGVRLVEDETDTLAASSMAGNIIEKDYERGKNTVIQAGRWYKQVGKIIEKESLNNGSVYLYVEFEGVNGARKYKCPIDPRLYYIVEKTMDSYGRSKVL
jgi:hypothetical protein